MGAPAPAAPVRGRAAAGAAAEAGRQGPLARPTAGARQQSICWLCSTDVMIGPEGVDHNNYIFIFTEKILLLESK